MIAKLLVVIALFARLSLLAVGGVNSTLPEIAAQVVAQHHWLTATQFSELFAIANSAPGPNMLIASLIGAHEAGIAGGIAATLAIILPAGILVMLVSRIWDRFRAQRWRRILQAALLPITAGLVLAAGLTLIRAADRSLLLIAITVVTAGVMVTTRLHPLWVLGGGALLGLVFG